MGSQYTWTRRWILPGTRETQATNLSALAQRWFPVTHQSSTDSFSLDDLASIPVVILLGEPGLGKTSEIADHFERISQQNNQHIWKLQQFPPDDFNRFFNHSQFRAWHDGQCDLTVFIDSFDEGLHPPISLGRHLVDALETTQGSLDKLHLRIACRTADWAEDTTNRLKKLFGEDSLLTIELDALGQKEVVEAATFHGIDANLFLELIDQNALAALTLKPITLTDLLKEYLINDRVLPATRNALYQNMCRRLCEEHNQFHDENDRRGNFTVDELIAEASRLATIMLTTRRLAIWMPSSTRDMRDNSIAIEKLHNGTSAEDRLVRATLHTGFFSSRGSNQLGWAHLSYAEYLAACYVHNNLSLPQIKSLLVHPDGSKIIPQLREVAAWLTTMNPTVLEFVTDLDPEALFQSDLIVEDTDAREKLTAIFLDLYHQEILIEPPFNSHARYRRLNHPRLSAQLINFACDGSKNNESRYVAISIIHACELSDAADGLVHLVLNPEEEYRLRVHAAYVVARVGSSEARLALKPLIIEGTQDTEDELKGAGLIATWPEHLTTTELFEALTPRKRENLAGTYSAFLRPEIIDDVPDNDLPLALRWAANFVKRYTDVHHHIDLEIQDIIDEIVYKGWLHLDEPGVPEALARLISAKVVKFHPLFGTERRQLDDRFQKVMDDLTKSEAKRRKLLLATINLVTSPEFEFHILAYSIPLLLNSDLAWFLDLLEKDNAIIPRDTLLRLIESVFRRWDSSHMNMMAQAMERSEPLREMFGKWFFVELNSEYANELRRAYERDQEHAAKYQEKEDKRKEQLLDPPPLKRLEELLDQCERGEIREWWRTNIMLAADEYGHYRDEFDDIRQMPNWEHLDQITRERLVTTGVEFVSNTSPETAEWFGKYVVWRPALAAYRMLLLLHDLGIELPMHVWQKWMPAVVSFPTYFVRSDETQQKIIGLAYQNDPEGLRFYLRGYLSYLHTPSYSGSIVEYYLQRFSGCFDGNLAQVLLDYLDDLHIKEEHYTGILRFLLEKRIPAAYHRAMSDFQNLYRNYKMVLAREFILVCLQEENHAANLQTASVILNRISKANEWRDEAVRLAANLVAFPLLGDWWHAIWTIIQADENFGRRIIEATADIYEDRRIAKIGAHISESATADLYLWIAERYPHHEDPDLYGGGFRMRAITPRHNVAYWRDSLLNQLAERGTLEALKELNRIGEAYPDLHQLKRLRKYLLEHLYKNTWLPPQVRDVLSLLKSNEQRFVQTDNQLFNVVIESLDRLQIRLQGETPSAVDLWNIVPSEAICRPMDERALSNYVKRHLEQDLKERGIVVNREVEIRQREGGEGAATGEIPDLYVSAVSHDSDGSGMKHLVVLIEVKGNWHDELKTAIQTQLVDRYLRNNDRATCGLYLVGWFNCQQWDHKDYRRNLAFRNELNNLSSQFKTQAEILSNAPLDVRVYVLDASLRESLS